eukprot:CAMPEP_0206297098 /NCGR_PEP_ID=MMETSP0106_2-20121207/6001_1 /ASSEMBLY_ACC=CAM_ASM_000206 /TAXON_ID=81532 /ORGANISM="Acanthoeca-like sp., Strain 10tr" /LENGTH=202 /DNA_ID=CAMNT_0053727761 /DNA_START=30 /DNA_END=635 /DNA_ORIENTATION=+
MNATEVPWCVRLDLAAQVARIVRLLDSQKLVHCDWKYDQLAVGMDGRVRIVDAKSIRWLPKSGVPYKSERKCGLVTRRGKTKNRGCRNCMKHIHLPVEHSCNTSSGTCRGYDTASLVAATGESVLAPLLQVHLTDAPGEGFAAAVADLVAGTTRPNPPDRLGTEQILARLAALEERFGAAACMATVDLPALIRKAYHSMWAG